MSIRNDVGLLAVTGFILYMFWLVSSAPAGSIDNDATRPYVSAQIATHAANTNLHIAAGNVYNITSTGSQDSAKLGGIAAASYLTNNHTGATFSGTTTFTNTVINGAQTNQQNITVLGAGTNYFAGRVGIGTNVPSAKLDVNGGAIIRGATTNTGSLTIQGLLSTTGGVTLATTEGNVGIGTNTPDANYKLHIHGGARLKTISLLPSLRIVSDLSNGKDISLYALRPGAANHGWQLKNESDGVLLMAGTTNGLVGIGTNDPAATLDVNGGAIIRTNLVVNGVQTNNGSLTVLGGGNVVTNGQMVDLANTANVALGVSSENIDTDVPAEMTNNHVLVAWSVEGESGWSRRLLPLESIETNTYAAGDLMRFNGTNWSAYSGYTCISNDLVSLQTFPLVTNGVLQYCDLSDIVPPGTRWLNFFAVSGYYVAGAGVGVYPASNLNSYVRVLTRCIVSGASSYDNGIIPCPPNRVVYTYATAHHGVGNTVSLIGWGP